MRSFNFGRSFYSAAHIAPVALIALGVLLACSAALARGGATPDPAVDDSLAASSSQQTAVLSGGCFWGVQLVFEHVKGVVKVTSGYSGGAAKTAQYEVVSTGTTGHAESVKIVYDPSKVTYGQLLKVFFSVAHDPTELNFQGPDHGTQYRSSIFYSDPNQQRVALAYIAQLDQARAFPSKIVTQVVPLQGFYPAEAYHQEFATQNPDNPYIATFDLPKLANLKKELPTLYVAH
jgi:peptide-methionine (S)-S-oxide reductase